MRELLQEADVVLVELADVVDAEEQHREALDAHPEREAGVALRIVADRLEHRRDAPCRSRGPPATSARAPGSRRNTSADGSV